MKRILLISLLLGMVISIHAQLSVNGNGHINIGTEPTVDIELPVWQQDTLTMVKIFGPYGNLKCGSRLSFGDMTYYNLNALIGECGTGDSDQLWLQSKHGYYFTARPAAQDTICYYDDNKGNYFQFNCDVRASGIFVASDSIFKENITPLDNTLSGLHQLSAVSYNLKPFFKASPSTRSAMQGGSTAKEQKDAEFYAAYYEKLKQEPPRFGFIAQDVKKIYPELVRADSTGYMYVDYIGMIPLLVNALNELKSQVDTQETLIADLQYEITDLKDGNSTVHINGKKKNIDGAESRIEIVPALYQNSPNPFSANTKIGFVLPHEVLQADMYIYNMQGSQIRKIEITDRGESSIILQGSELSAGMYIYALIADGKEIDSKRMILTK